MGSHILILIQKHYFLHYLCLEDERIPCKILSSKLYFPGHMTKQVSFLMVMACISLNLHKIIKLPCTTNLLGLFCQIEKK